VVSHLFFTDVRALAVARVYQGLIRQFVQFAAYGLILQNLLVAARKIGATYVTVE
jgi:hypothetical protein